MRSILLVLPLVFLTHCAKFESKSSPLNKSQSVTPLGVQTETTQIGDFYERTAVGEEFQGFYQSSIFKLDNDLSGKKGIATYLGEFNNKYLFMTAKHVLNSETETCDEMVSVSSLNEAEFFICTGDIVSLKDMDITIFLTERLIGDGDLRPLHLSGLTGSGTSNTTMRTIDRESNLIVADGGKDCFVLDKTPQLIFDPDEETSLFSSSWSVPIGCDAQPGDSGAPVMDMFGDVVGVLWGGRATKYFKSSADLKRESENLDPKIWKNYNFMVPAHIVLSKLEELSKNKDSLIGGVLAEVLAFNSLKAKKMAQVEGLEPPTR